MTDALYDDLCDAVKAVCLHLDTFSHQSAPLGYHRWARAFVAGCYSRKTAERALELALPGAAFNDESDALAVLARAAASAVAVAVLNAIDGDETRAQRVAHTARVIVDLLGHVAAEAKPSAMYAPNRIMREHEDQEPRQQYSVVDNRTP